MGSPKVDALFAGDAPTPADNRPAIGRLRWLLGLAIPMNVLGVLCWTGVPGAALTLWAWLLADDEAARVRAGEVEGEDGETVLRLRGLAAWNLGLCVVSLLVQAWLLTTSFYELLLARVLGAGG